jgi:thiol-disulfide isomerase/thioredoxin
VGTFGNHVAKIVRENWLLLLVIGGILTAFLFLRTPASAVASVEEVEAILQNGKPTFVEFYSNTWSACLLAKPAVDRLEQDLEGQAEVLRLSAWSSVGRQLSARYGVRGVPTFLLFDGSGQLTHYQVGRLDADQVKAEIDSLGRW